MDAWIIRISQAPIKIQFETKCYKSKVLHRIEVSNYCYGEIFGGFMEALSLNFIKEIIDIIIWPIVTLILAFTFKEHIVSIFPRMTKMKIGEKFEVELSKNLNAISKKAEEEFPDHPGLIDEFTIKVDLIELAEISPNAAVIESWKIVEAASKDLIKKKNIEINFTGSTTYKQIENILVKGGLINQKKGKIFRDLRRLRNKVAHAKNFYVTVAQSLQYIDISLKLKDYLVELLSSSR